MKAMVRVLTQYWENYSDTNVPYWKPKGGQEFNVFVDTDVLMYSEEQFESAINDFLAVHHSNGRVRHTYVSHTTLFFAPIVIDQEAFDKVLDSYLMPEPRDPETVVFSAMQEGTDGG